MARITRRRGIRYAALVPNEKGAVRAIEAGVDAIHTVLSASESHNLANVNMTIAESLDRLGAVLRVAAAAKLHVGCGISTSFGCPFEGDVPLAQLERVVGRLIEMGARAVGLADTTGMANPRQVGRVLEHLIPRFPGIEWTLHTHDTRAMAIANILAAMEHGVTNFDASIGGLGGCPFAPGASGNVCTEDLVHCLHAMGVQTGIDLDRLIGVGRKVKVIQGDALRLLPLLPGRFDFVFIDAAKEDYLDYVRSLEPKLVAGTVVVADNTGMYRKDVAPYLEHVRGSADYASREHEFDDDAMEVSLYRSPRT